MAAGTLHPQVGRGFPLAEAAEAQTLSESGHGHGRISTISAPTARVPIPFMAPIGASKAALASFSDALRLELTVWAIPVIVIEPGGAGTAIFRKVDAAGRVALYSDRLAAVAKAAARQRLGPVAPVARTAVAAVQARNLKCRYTAGLGAG